ncbi:MAG: gamma carbonic anhydrase family protein, partial [Rhodococcus erythropolis]|nr:gamma carbonic anhydrase family protein [Rhodococcus erythropolis]
GAVVANKMQVPPRSMALGVPAKVRAGYEVPLGHLDGNVKMYAANAAYYRDALRRLD